MLKQLSLKGLKLGSRKDIIHGHDCEKKFYVKIQLKKLDRKSNDLRSEYDIIKKLNKKECQTCPTVVSFETIEKNRLLDISDESCHVAIKSCNEDMFDVMIQKFVDSNSKDYSIADIVLAMVEQKSLGYYQGDIKPDNIRYDSNRSTCVFIDYDQAIKLSKEEQTMPIDDFMNFCDAYDLRKYGFGNWLRHFSKSFRKDMSSIFVNGMLDLSKTRVMKNQITTNSETGIYHSINGPYVYAAGSRSLVGRQEVLDNIELISDEKVLDVGCNMGLLSSYLYGRGCDVVGIDNDPRIVVLAKVVSNILGEKIRYECIDLDDVDQLEKFDTIFLFSVFHHTREPVKNAKKIVDSCKKIVIETRLVENGKQPLDGVWTHTTSWSFKSLGNLNTFLETIFEGFKIIKSPITVDKGRYVIELVKNA
jgi:hypothetical protein